MDADYPTQEQLVEIETWDYTAGFEKLAEKVCAMWHFQDWAEFRDWKKDEFGDRYRELRLATAGWSGNEEIISALNENRMFTMMCWQSSHRGGLHIYHIKDLKE